MFSDEFGEEFIQRLLPYAETPHEILNSSLCCFVRQHILSFANDFLWTKEKCVLEGYENCFKDSLNGAIHQAEKQFTCRL
jgi:hypothetical protein